MATGSFNIKGMDAVFRRLRALPPEFHKKVLMGGMRDGAEVIASAVKANAQRLDDPQTPQVIAQNVAVRFSPRRYKRTGDVMYRVGVLGGAQAPSGDGDDGRSANPGGLTWYWRFLEFGTSKMRARPFFRPAVEESQQRAFQAAADGMTRRMDKLKL